MSTNRFWYVTAKVSVQTPSVQRTRQIPTFVLDGSMYAIRDEGHAASIARQVLVAAYDEDYLPFITHTMSVYTAQAPSSLSPLRDVLGDLGQALGLAAQEARQASGTPFNVGYATAFTDAQQMITLVRAEITRDVARDVGDIVVEPIRRAVDYMRSPQVAEAYEHAERCHAEGHQNYPAEVLAQRAQDAANYYAMQAAIYRAKAAQG